MPMPSSATAIAVAFETDMNDCRVVVDNTTRTLRFGRGDVKAIFISSPIQLHHNIFVKAKKGGNGERRLLRITTHQLMHVPVSCANGLFQTRDDRFRSSGSGFF